MTTVPHKTLDSPPVEVAADQEHREVVGETDVVLDQERSTECRGSHAKCTGVIVHCDGYGTGSRILEVPDDDDDGVGADYSRRIERVSFFHCYGK